MKLYQNKEEILNDLLLLLNEELYEKGMITYSVYELTQNKLLERL